MMCQQFTVSYVHTIQLHTCIFLRKKESQSQELGEVSHENAGAPVILQVFVVCALYLDAHCKQLAVDQCILPG